MRMVSTDTGPGRRNGGVGDEKKMPSKVSVEKGDDGEGIQQHEARA